MKSRKSVFHQCADWIKKHRTSLAMVFVILLACVVSSCAALQLPSGVATPTISNGPQGKVIRHAGHEFHSSFDQPPHPVGGMAAFRSMLYMPGAFYRDVEPGGPGKVRLEVWIRADGTLQRVTLVHSDHSALDDVVLEALKEVSWLPAKKNGKAVGAVFVLPVSFRIRD